MGSETKPIRLKAMSFNILHGEGIDRKLDLARVARVIRESGADVIGLQEVDRHYGERSAWADQGAELAELLGMHYAYGANLQLAAPEEGQPLREYGTLVLSRYPIVRQTNYALSQLREAGVHPEKRGLLETRIDVDGAPLVFYNTHFGLGTEERQIQASELLEKLEGCAEPVIVAGDFNATPDTPEIGRLRERLTDAFGAMGLEDVPTLVEPSKDDRFEQARGEERAAYYRPTKRIDFLFSSPSLELLEAERIEPVVSDHYAITAVYHYPESARPAAGRNREDY
ncbi:metal-dependent hydrolase [Paenibacillus sp. J31TS4]|uniref:endonuclease/exonuclease/phosphatase family protein n=1 Tax=Paenibacillus sp. J31TS4 TaxID=2807195 RepID=UPI001B23F33F|nr:endonuclease/exonuclease/phosphatase family protein [Paenibacillus sp. J31TS4]GIP40347.1 metal-dependent hydrolase [Paenibacillus sp. J31TS4]